MGEKFGLDRMIQSGPEPLPDPTEVVNPARRHRAALPRSAARPASWRNGGVFCAIGMPGQDGGRVFDGFQKLPQRHGIPGVAWTAMTEREVQRTGRTLGVEDFITKPSAEREILAVIKARIRRQKPLRKRIEALVADRRHEAGAEWSHELMTPLTGLLGGLELIEAELDSVPPKQRKGLRAVIRGGAARQYQLSEKSCATSNWSG